MLKIKIAAAALLLGTVFASSAFATTVKSLSPAWQMTGSNPATWVLPASIPGCGSENETSCEPTGVFITSTAIGGITSGYFTLADANGTTSDYILWDNVFGQGRFRFFSDPNVPGSLPAFNAGALCVEDDTTGCNFNGNFLMADGSILSLNAASDGEAAFDPFGTGGDHSDGIRFNNAIGVVPEPMTLALFGAGLAGLGAMRRRKARKTA